MPAVEYCIVGFSKFEDDGLPPGNDHSQDIPVVGVVLFIKVLIPFCGLLRQIPVLSKSVIGLQYIVVVSTLVPMHPYESVTESSISKSY